MRSLLRVYDEYYFRKLGLKCAAFHSGLKKHEKEQVQNDWTNGILPVIAATVSFGNFQ